MSSMPLVFGSNLTLEIFLLFAFLKTFPLGVTFRVQLGVRVGVSITLWLGLWFSIGVRGLH